MAQPIKDKTTTPAATLIPMMAPIEMPPSSFDLSDDSEGFAPSAEADGAAVRNWVTTLTEPPASVVTVVTLHVSHDL